MYVYIYIYIYIHIYTYIHIYIYIYYEMKIYENMKIYVTYVGNILDYIEILCRENILEFCCYFKTKQVLLFFRLGVPF